MVSDPFAFLDEDENEQDEIQPLAIDATISKMANDSPETGYENWLSGAFADDSEVDPDE